MDYTQIPTIQRRRATVDQRIAWHGVLSAPGKTAATNRQRIASAIRVAALVALAAIAMLALSYEPVLTVVPR